MNLEITNLEVIFGWSASFLCTLILLPQIFKVIKTKKTNDISMPMLILSVFGNLFWVAHAVLMSNLPLTVGAGLICLMSLILIVFKYQYDEKNINMTKNTKKC